MSALVKLEIPPGVYRAGTVYQSSGRWYDVNFVRWHEGAMKPVGGWAARTVTPMTGKARAMIIWRADDSTRFYVVGTHSKLYAFTQSVTAGYDITPAGFTAGRADATAVGGYGGGLYGAGTYGTPRVDNTTIQDATMWTMDTFGQYWYGVSPDDTLIYKWTLNTGAVAVALGGTAPTNNSAIVVSPERFVFSLGAAGVKRRVQWADQESDSTWTASATNQAGDFDIQSQGRLMCGKRLRATTVIWTDLDVHIAEYIGLPYVYRFTRVGENCGIISRGAGVTNDSTAIWMGINGFYIFDGVTRPIPCDVYDYVFSDINLVQRSKVTAVLNSQFNEVWWYYPSSASTENDRYVFWNYAENHWGIGTLARTCGNDRGTFVYPILCDASGYAYDHESGSSYGGSLPYAESGPFEIGNGRRIGRVRRLITDEKTVGDVSVTFKTRNWPSGTETSYGPYTLANPTSVRFSARAARLRIDGVASSSWRWGTPRIDVLEGSVR
jgi:hypothetical protein